MKQLTNKEYVEYEKYKTAVLHGRVITPDGLRIICAGLDNDPEKIGTTCWRCWLSSGMKESWIKNDVWRRVLGCQGRRNNYLQII